MTPLVILGCGFLGSRIARAALAEGRAVRACARSTGRLQPLAAAGAEVKFVDASVPKHLTQALAGAHGATVVYAIPPVGALPPGLAMRAALQAAYGGGAEAFIYFSSTGLYGDEPDDDAWIDEDTPLQVDPAMRNVLSDEEEIARSGFDRLRTVRLRIAPVYGGGRGIRARLRKGDYRILDDGQHATSRVHVDDLVRVVFAAEQKAQRGAIYMVADDEPTTQGEYARWLTERLGLPMPPSKAILEPGKPRTAHRNRRIKNARMKAELGVTLAYPSFREGEAQIDAEEAAAT